jgi:ribonuclease HI
MPTTTRSRQPGDDSPERGSNPPSLPPATRPDALRLVIHTDGAARGNPGLAGAGAVLRSAADGSLVSELAVFLGERTNNYAEWTAVALALEEAVLQGATHVDLRMDSELVARQITGRYRVKHPDLKPIHARVMALLAGFAGYTIGHVPRELNKEADRLSNVAIDQIHGG